MDIGIRPDVSRAAYPAFVKAETKPEGEIPTAGEKQEGVSLGIKIDKWEGKPGEISEMQTSIIPKEQLETIRQTLKEMSGKLEVDQEANLRRKVDPDGKIYGAAFVEGIVRQYQEMETQIRDYYADAHKESMSYKDPYNHILQKYVFDASSPFGQSPFFRSDMSKAERDWAFRQERAILWGSNIALNDPYALAAHGGVKNIEEIDANAHQYAQAKLDGLIAEYKQAHGLADD
ncbi:MAG: hypothetical protein HFF80_07355 [Oscillospiraceae bacterium]|nr:hypothetical protein [Oscillospiraceae bacterium]